MQLVPPLVTDNEYYRPQRVYDLFVFDVNVLRCIQRHPARPRFDVTVLSQRKSSPSVIRREDTDRARVHLMMAKEGGPLMHRLYENNL